MKHILTAAVLRVTAAFNPKNVKPTDAMIAFWQTQKAKKRPMLPIHVIVHLEGSTQPPGYIQAWSANPAVAKTQQRSIKGKTKLVVLVSTLKE